MKCVICKGSDIELKTVDEQIRLGKDIVLVPMNILVCSSCGERYYDRKSMKKIEQIRSKLKNQKHEVKQVGILAEIAAHDDSVEGRPQARARDLLVDERALGLGLVDLCLQHAGLRSIVDREGFAVLALELGTAAVPLTLLRSPSPPDPPRPA